MCKGDAHLPQTFYHAKNRGHIDIFRWISEPKVPGFRCSGGAERRVNVGMARPYNTRYDSIQTREHDIRVNLEDSASSKKSVGIH